MTLATGGTAFGEISMRSSPAISAAFMASANVITPRFSPRAPITRSSGARISRFIRIFSVLKPLQYHNKPVGTRYFVDFRGISGRKQRTPRRSGALGRGVAIRRTGNSPVRPKYSCGHAVQKASVCSRPGASEVHPMSLFEFGAASQMPFPELEFAKPFSPPAD